MAWAFGPILTAGVALGAAAVVVANPIVVPRADVQIAVSDLPTSVTGDSQRGAAIAMLDEDFIQAVGPGPAPSTHPLAVLTDLVRVLVADAAYLGKNAVLHAFSTGAKVIAEPVLTSTSYPYVAAVPAPYVPLVPADAAALPWLTPTAPPAVTDTGDLGPVVAQALTAILADVSDVTGVRAVAAAFAAGAALATEHLPVVGSVVDAVQQDLGQIIGDPISVLAVMPRTRESIGDGIRTVVGHLPLIGPIVLWEPPSAAQALPSASVPVPDSPSAPDAEAAAATPVAGPSPSGAEGATVGTVEPAASSLSERRTVARRAGAESDPGAEASADTTVVDQPAELSPEPGADLPGADAPAADAPDAAVGQRAARAAAEAPGQGRATRR